MNGYGLRYSGGFYDSDGNTITVEIHKKDYASLAESITLNAENPVVISKPQGDLLTHIFGTGCKINIINNGDFLQYSDLFGTPENEHYVIITRYDGVYTVILFEGFILPQMYNQTLKYNSQITLPANDQLSNLKEKKIDTIFNINNNFFKLIDFITNIIWSTGLHNPIYIKNGLYNTAYPFYTSGYTVDYTPFDHVFVEKQMFLDVDGEPLDSYSILETILKSFESRLYYNNGAWYIDRIKNSKNLNSYKVYYYDNSFTTYTPTKKITNLNNHNIISNTGTLEYEAGVKDYELTLNMNLFDNLVNESFDNLKGAVNPTQINYGGGKTDIFTKPNRYDWSANNLSYMSYITPYKDANIVNNGIDWYVSAGGSIPYYRSKITTKLIIDWDKEATLNIRFKTSLIGIGIDPNKIYNVRYSLRYEKSTAPYGFKWIYKSGDKLYTETDVINNLDNCVFDKTLLGQAILDSSTPNCIEVNDTINIGELMDEIKGDLSPSGLLPFVTLYFDVYLIGIIPTPTYSPFRMRMGDFNISYSKKLSENVIEASIDTAYNSKLDLSLDLFDNNSISLKNTLMFYNITSGNYESTIRYPWSEFGYTHKMALQYMYLTNLIQNYSQNRYKLSLDVRVGTKTTLFNLDNIFTYSHITKDGSPVDMLCMGYDYNVKNCTYKLTLQEWTDDDGYYLLEDAELIDPSFITITPPNSFGIGVNGGGDIIFLTSNTKWYVTTDVDWIIFYQDEGFGDGSFSWYARYMDDPNTPRTGYITITSEDGTASDIATVYQSAVYDT